MRSKIIVLAGLVGLLAGAPADARTKSGITMPDQIELAGKTLVLNGMGTREATVFNVNVYVAGLYLERRSSDPNEILSTPQTIVLHMYFVRDVGRKDVVEAWTKGFQKNTPDEAEPALADRVARLNSWMTDFEEGDRLTFAYSPGKGTEVHANDVAKGTIQGDDFGRALFSIWLGPSPPNKGLKKGLLGK
jgi:hypothetical protein